MPDLRSGGSSVHRKTLEKMCGRFNLFSTLKMNRGKVLYGIVKPLENNKRLQYRSAKAFACALDLKSEWLSKITSSCTR
jgi:hypothetical protein